MPWRHSVTVIYIEIHVQNVAKYCMYIIVELEQLFSFLQAEKIRKSNEKSLQNLRRLVALKDWPRSVKIL
jgi:hypothetical protein